MQLKLDKTVVLVAATKALADVQAGYDNEQLQILVDILSTEKAKFIQSVDLDAYEYSRIEYYLEEI